MSERLFTDEELCWAAKVAYCNVDEFDIDEYRRLHGGAYPTLQEIFSEIYSEKGYDIWFNKKTVTGEHTGDALKMEESVKAFIDGVIAGEICQGWRLVSVEEQQRDNGFYGLTIETSEDTAIVAFRGSEATDIYQKINDWIVADFDIINGGMTEQELAAGAYIDYIGNNFSYKNFALTGHSLGGDLALCGAIYSATDKSESDMCTRIKQAVSLDGPGHPEEFLETYQKEIDKMSGVMTHYQWSLIGAIFTSICEKNGTYIHIVSDRFVDPFSSLMSKHALESLEMNNGMLERYIFFYDPLAELVHSVTDIVDDVNGIHKDLAGIIDAVIKGAQEYNDWLRVVGENNLALKEACMEYFVTGAIASLYISTYMDLDDNNNVPLDSLANACLAYYNAEIKLLKHLKESGLLALEVYKIKIDFLGDLYDAKDQISSSQDETQRELHDYMSTPEGIWNLFSLCKSVTFLNNYIDESCKKLFISTAVDFGIDIATWHLHNLGLLDTFYTTASTAERAVKDPLVFDLDRDGFEILAVEDGVYFDEDNAGLKEKTEWVAPDDGLLAIDLNQDGIINDGSELFGTSTVLADGTYARSGFEALAQYDENQDGVIDKNDSVFSKLLVWQDKNSDGISQEDELYTLQDLGVESISLKYADDNGVNAADVTFEDGTTSKVGEFDFDAHLYDVNEKEETEISEEIKKLPNVRAIGNVASLHTLMQLDETGQLKEYVNQFVQATSASEREETLTKILYFITGAEQIASNSRGSEFDAQKLTVIEQFLGKNFVGTQGSNPVNTAADILKGIYTDIFEMYYAFLSEETILKDYLSMTFWTTDESGKQYLDTTIFDVYVAYSDNKNMIDVVAEMGRYIASMNQDNRDNFADFLRMYSDRPDYLSAIAERSKFSVIIGADEKDTLYSDNENTFILGLAGNDTLNGRAGDDYLIGGTGDDILSGGAGADTYYIGAEDGNDTIKNTDTGESRKEDRIVYGEGIRAEDIEVRRSDRDMLLINTRTGQVTTVQYQYSSENNALEKVEFADGTVWTLEDLIKKTSEIRGSGEADRLFGYGSAYGYEENETFYGYGGDDYISAGTGNDTLYGGDGNDTLYGGAGDDILYGEAGNDSLYGDAGDDYLIGGAGDDILSGGAGADTYYIGVEDGNDTIKNTDTGESRKEDRIVYGEGIRAEDIEVRRSDKNMLLINTKTGQVTTVQFQYSSANYALEKVEFADGTVWTLEELMKKQSEIRGSEEADRLFGYGSAYGYEENETFYGYGGDDYISAGTGNDILYGGEGKDTLYGGAGDDTLYGEAGNDTLYGEAGDDYLIGGAGDDILNGGAGADTYYIGAEDGNDTINNSDMGESRKEDRIVYGEGICAEDIEVRRSDKNMLLINTKTGQVTTVQFQYSSANYALEKVEFADGTVWTLEELMKKQSEIRGSEEADRLFGYGSAYGYEENETFYGYGGDDYISAGTGNDILYGGEGNDILYGGAGDDTLYGETGNDSLYGDAGDDYLVGGSGDDFLSGGAGNDVLYGGIGNDRLDGGIGDDTYYFYSGDGQDIIYDYEATSDNNDTLIIDVDANQLLFKKSGYDLLICILNTDDSIRINKWYSGSAYHIENIKSGDGYSLSHTQVDLLIQSMASFESTSGMSWEDAVAAKDENINELISQMWVKQSA